MKHAIDPKIDCVFKALLGAERNRRLLIHFLNAILAGDLAAPISAVEILNPYNEREFPDDKLSRSRSGTGCARHAPCRATLRFCPTYRSWTNPAVVLNRTGR